jgi:hypothetical protein
MAEVPGAKPSVNEASFTGQTQEQCSGAPRNFFAIRVHRFCNNEFL